MKANPTIQSYADAERIEAASGGMILIARCDARMAALFDMPIGFAASFDYQFSLLNPDKMLPDTIKEIRDLRRRLAQCERKLRKMS